MIKSIFQRKTVNCEKLLSYGFLKDGGAYSFHTVLPGSAFEMNVSVSKTGSVAAEVIDPALGEQYTLHLAAGAVGKFAIGVRTEYEHVLTEIAGNCFDMDVFKTAQAKELIAYARKAYGDELEYLWSRFPDNAIWRRQDNKKWYGALLTVSSRKLGIDSDKMIEIIDLRIQPEKLEQLLDGKHYFPGWHMNKKNWFTMILNGSVPLEEIIQRLDESYLLAVK